jgi:hypothetical protein
LRYNSKHENRSVHKPDKVRKVRLQLGPSSYLNELSYSSAQAVP